MGACTSQGSNALTKNYELEVAHLLGEGSYSIVFQGRYKLTGERVAIKRIDKQRSVSSQMWEDEIAMLRQCARHENIIELRDVYQTAAHVFIVTELAEGGELFQALINDGAYSEWDAKRYILDVFHALQFLHQQNIVHRDVKPENLLLTTKDSKTARIKLADFGMAKIIKDASMLGCEHLTWAYCAPEVLQEEGVSAYDAKSDIWSVGIVLHVLLTGWHPFDVDGRQTKTQMVESIRLGKFDMSEGEVWESVSNDAKDLLRQLLCVDRTKRLTATQALGHAWFASPHTPRSPLSVSVSGGLGHYQRKMLRKFRASVLVAMAAEVLRRSIQKGDDTDNNNNNNETHPQDAAATVSSVVSDEAPVAPVNEHVHPVTDSVTEDGNSGASRAPPPKLVSARSQFALLFGKQASLRQADDAQTPVITTAVAADEGGATSLDDIDVLVE
ncbi:TPA: hypothetical protein N0F65_008536 [Lagenidium giganteum]|uniref:Protein kinase domain-containing protein n=1 Tax=Lagenidium giganteum TaxID=4803 RepID=A0AAV2YRI8_9STRA|nr:TPA: hypothetical protein N0F65_008536 [Lagenidium giganteum]